MMATAKIRGPPREQRALFACSFFIFYFLLFFVSLLLCSSTTARKGRLQNKNYRIKCKNSERCLQSWRSSHCHCERPTGAKQSLFQFLLSLRAPLSDFSPRMVFLSSLRVLLSAFRPREGRGNLNWIASVARQKMAPSQ